MKQFLTQKTAIDVTIGSDKLKKNKEQHTSSPILPRVGRVGGDSQTMLAIFQRNNTKYARRMNRKGNMELFGWVLAAGTVLITVGILVYVISILDDSITDPAATEVYNNTIQMFTNFTAQLGPVGTLAGVFLIFGLLGIVGIGVWRAGRSRGMF